jgi:hypothetical protein
LKDIYGIFKTRDIELGTPKYTPKFDKRKVLKGLRKSLNSQAPAAVKLSQNVDMKTLLTEQETGRVMSMQNYSSR